MHSKIATEKRQDSDLWLDILKNDKVALANLFQLYYQRLYNYGRKLVSCEDFVKDCIQELFLTIWEQRATLSEAYSVKSYLYCCMRRTLFKNLKKKKNIKNRDCKYVSEFSEERFNIEERMIHGEIRTEYKYKLDRAINSLSSRQKEVICLKYYDGFSNKEIAHLMNIKCQSVYNHVSEALSVMQHHVK